ncbi:MAG: hypothetical protein Q7U38_09490 [Methylobacter sp.]|nr:hypothetical protein [Methylobacter sp.]MDP2100001.1 hypothetical protein [Methylobacter sp.]MDP2427553.1 hypothetical protein [Methylobacter sp.]MDP3054517.1 hypothetical protein [Methylobacter sp.]MDP3362625.1 hypothetical protein [Methylobacter sp.]
MSRRLIYFMLLQSACYPAFAVQPVPALRMHVFEQAPSAPLPTVRPATPEAADNDRRFQMVVFQPNAAPQRSSQQQAQVQPLNQYPRHGTRRKTANDFSVLMTTDIGYQQERLNWSVATPGSSDPLIEAKWDNIDLMRVKGRFDLVSPSGVAVRTEAGYAWAVSGSGEQTRLGLPANANPANEGYSWNASAALGYRFRFDAPTAVGFSVTPLAGYTFHRQRFTLQGAEKNVYNAEWDGPWLGMDATLSWLDDHELFASVQHHWATYQGAGDWRQLADVAHPNSFEHKADATGLYGAVGYRYHWTEAWGLSLSMDYQHWQADSGQEQFYLSSGSVIESPITDISRQSLGINLGVHWTF